jgi:hypothetical protein
MTLRYLNITQSSKETPDYSLKLFSLGNFSDQVVIEKASEIKEFIQFSIDVRTFSCMKIIQNTQTPNFQSQQSNLQATKTLTFSLKLTDCSR